MENERLKKQLEFCREIDKEKFIGRQTLSQMHRQKKTMPSMHGIWLS